MITEHSLRNGMILHVRTSTRYGRLIRFVLRSWGNHDALAWFDGSGQWQVLDAVSPVAKLTPWAELCRDVATGKAQVRAYWPREATAAQGNLAAEWWLRHVLNSPYDWLGIVRLAIKAIFGSWLPGVAGWEWANWCTEGCANAWTSGAGRNVWQKQNPTPLTTEKRVDVTLDLVDS